MMVMRPGPEDSRLGGFVPRVLRPEDDGRRPPVEPVTVAAADLGDSPENRRIPSHNSATGGMAGVAGGEARNTVFRASRPFSLAAYGIGVENSPKNGHSGN